MDNYLFRISANFKIGMKQSNILDYLGEPAERIDEHKQWRYDLLKQDTYSYEGHTPAI